MVLLPYEIIFDDEKGLQARGHAIIHRFSSVLRRVAPFKSLLHFLSSCANSKPSLANLEVFLLS